MNRLLSRTDRPNLDVVPIRKSTSLVICRFPKSLSSSITFFVTTWVEFCHVVFHSTVLFVVFVLSPIPPTKRSISLSRGPIDQFRYIKIHPNRKDLSTRLWRITTEFVGFIPPSLLLRSFVLGWILIYRNWSIFIPHSAIKFFVIPHSILLPSRIPSNLCWTLYPRAHDSKAVRNICI